MHAPQPLHADLRRQRELETTFLTERYHRTFADECEVLERALKQANNATLLLGFAQLQQCLAQHMGTQEQRLFPAYASGQPMAPDVFEAWLIDAGALAACAEAVRGVWAASARGSLGAQLAELAADVERHVADEFLVLASWTGPASGG
jgi:hypothetical protein